MAEWQRDIPLYIYTRIFNIYSLANPRWLKKRLDLDAFYSSIQSTFASFGPPYGAADNKIVPNGFFWSSLAVNVLLQSREYSDEPTQNQCSKNEEEITQYSYLHTETCMLMLGLMVLSWLKANLKKKTEDGHCRNPIHRETSTNKSSSCPIGSNFHRDLYDNYSSILEDFISSIRDCTPITISSSKQK
ncbi:MAG: hypothetical protein WBX01_04075 [Nitrososphaeraceae archaeon]